MHGYCEIPLTEGEAFLFKIFLTGETFSLQQVEETRVCFRFITFLEFLRVIL